MATLTDEQKALADRLGEDSVPTNTNELAKRIRLLNQGIKKLLSDRYYYFLENTYFLSGTGLDYIAKPTTCRDIRLIWADGNIFYPEDQNSYLRDDNYDLCNTFSIYGSVIHFSKEITIKASLATTLTISGTTVTATTASNHGLQSCSYTVVSGCNQPLANGTVKVTAIISDTQFQYEIAANSYTELTGTILSKKINIIAFGWDLPTSLVADSDICVVPDEFCPAIDAYAASKLERIRGRRASAQDNLSEFTDIQMDMNKENMRRKIFNKDNNYYFDLYGEGGAVCTS